MLTQSEIDGMRDTSESALPDTCEITRSSEEPTLNLATGDLAAGDLATIYEGVCRVRAQEAQETNAESGELHITTGRYICTLPYDADDIIVDDYLTVLTSSDSEMVGRSFQIVHVGWSAFQIDRRLVIKENEQPQGVREGS